jgi:2-acylglycerol O-acyltransferase 2
MRPRKALMKHLRIAIPLFWGAWGSPVPKPGTLAVVVGTPMRIKKVEPEAITRQLVDETHAAFVDALRALFDKHKKQCGYPDAELEVF